MKLRQRKCRLDNRESFSPREWLSTRMGFPREAVTAPGSVWTILSGRHMVWSLGCPTCGQDLDSVILMDPSQLGILL